MVNKFKLAHDTRWFRHLVIIVITNNIIGTLFMAALKPNFLSKNILCTTNYYRAGPKLPLMTKAAVGDDPQLQEPITDFPVPEFKKISDIIDHVDVNDTTKWVTIRSESVELNRAEFIVNKFIETFPDITLPKDNNKAYELIGRLASRTDVIADWLANTSVLFSDEAQTPAYLLKFINPKTFKTVQGDITNYNRIARRESDEAIKASTKYSDEVKMIRQKYNKERKKLRDISNYVKILTIPSTKLPLTVQLAIENFTPYDVQSAVSKLQYARELLTDYKIFLLEQLRDNPRLDIDAVVEANCLK